MTKENRLRHYRMALWDYRLSYLLGKRRCNTYRGLCFYFKMQGIELSNLPELISLWSPSPLSRTTGFWFPRGDLSPRIKLLKRAIKNCKK